MDIQVIKSKVLEKLSPVTERLKTDKTFRKKAIVVALAAVAAITLMLPTQDEIADQAQQSPQQSQVSSAPAASNPQAGALVAPQQAIRPTMPGLPTVQQGAGVTTGYTYTQQSALGQKFTMTFGDKVRTFFVGWAKNIGAFLFVWGVISVFFGAFGGRARGILLLLVGGFLFFWL